MSIQAREGDVGWFLPGLVCGLIIGVLAGYIDKQTAMPRNKPTNGTTLDYQEPPEELTPHK